MRMAQVCSCSRMMSRELRRLPGTPVPCAAGVSQADHRRLPAAHAPPFRRFVDMSPMKKSSKVWISVAAGVVVLGVAGAIAAPYVYRDLIAGPADAVPTVALTTDPEAKT